MSARDDDRSRAMTAGAVDFLVKPLASLVRAPSRQEVAMSR